MKLKFLENINAYDEHAIRLNDFDKAQASLFMQILTDLVENKKNSISLLDYEFIEPVNCELTLRISETDEGIITDDNIAIFLRPYHRRLQGNDTTHRTILP